MKIDIPEKHYNYDDESFETMISIQKQGNVVIRKYLDDYMHHIFDEHEKVKPVAYALIEMAYRCIRLSEQGRSPEETQQIFDVLSYFAANRVETLLTNPQAKEEH